MRNSSARVMIGLAVVLLFSASAFAQRGQRGGRGQAPAVSVPHDPHDLAGIWISRGQSLSSQPPPMTPWGQEQFNAHKPSYGPRAVVPAKGNDPTGKCDPLGYPRILFFGRPVEIIQLPNRILELFEWGRVLREIWTDGRELPKDPDPKWLGIAVGKWEGETFVVNSVGFDERAWIDHFGNPHSEEMLLEERYHRLDRDTLEITLTIDDPKTYTKPWVSDKQILKLQPNESIREEFCVPSEEESFNQGVRNPAGGVSNK
ncbi:MAG TPA: hypothetical protein VE422_35665 [Terriglobia bacterium]|nr:hypothetical protein [Terriglobia bacterium]